MSRALVRGRSGDIIPDMLSVSSPAAVVVEGPSDTKAVHKAVDCITIETLGMDVEGALPDIREALARPGGVVIMTDSDKTGERIRDYIHQHVPGCLDARVRSSNGKARAAVEKASSEEIIRALRDSGAELRWALPILNANCNALPRSTTVESR
jgi:ribonuclease M5